MANIIITLLTSKRTRQTIDALDSVVAAQAGGYVVVEGEASTTQIDVNYPEAYAGQTCYVYMKNARGEYETKLLTDVGQTKTFNLPASMTYKGNTYLVFYAEQDGVQTVWTPVVVPVAETGVDYMKAATASEDIIRQMLEATQEAAKACLAVETKAKNGEFNGESVFVRFSFYPDGRDMTKEWQQGQCYMGVLAARQPSLDYTAYDWTVFVGRNVFVRYSAYADGRSMTETWEQGQKYIGTLVAETASEDYTAYSWSLFVGDAFCTEDATSGTASITLADETDQTLTGELTTLSITIPSTAAHGFYAGLNFKSGETPPTVVFTNGSGLPLKVIMRGALVEDYTPQANKTVQMLAYSDGINLYIYTNEV
jgi:hypothetical protein